ncbi:MAG: DUF1015 domain-containing protein [Ktedonobacteraceae bacterium]
MADVQPLRGLRYASDKIHDLVEVLTPPFDVIDPEAQLRYYRRNRYNVIRLELGMRYPSDDMLNTVYTRAAAALAEWRLIGVLQQEAIPGYYLYQQRFTYADVVYTRTSLLARVRLEPWDARVVLPHEQTRTKDREDRLQLLRACSTNFSPIMSMYDDPRGTMQGLLASYAEQPEVQLIDEAGEEHRLQPITDPEHTALIQEFFSSRQLYIADGHHRYTTALHYRNEVREQRKGLDPMDGTNFVLMALVAVEDPGMLVLPTHRILSDLPQDRLAALTPEHLAPFFTVQALKDTASPTSALESVAHTNAPSFILKTATQTLLLTLNERGAQRMVQSGRSAAWNALDVAVVQELVLTALLGITAEDIAAGKYVRYSHTMGRALHALQADEAQALLLLRGIPFQQVRDVALADDRMPQKSTYLYPKLITGLVMNPLW